MSSTFAMRRALDAVHHIADPAPPWKDLLKDSSELMNADGGAFIVYRDGRVSDIHTVGADPAAERDYVQHFHCQDVLRYQGAPRPAGTWIDTEETFSRVPRERNEYFVDFMCKYRMRHMTSLVIEENQHYQQGATISFQRAQPYAKAGELVASESLKQFRIALQLALARRRADAENWLTNAQQALNLFGDELLLIEVNGAVTYAGPHVGVVLEASCDLRVRQGRLWHPKPRVVTLLRAAVATTTSTGAIQRVRIPGRVGHSCMIEFVRAHAGLRLERSYLALMRVRHLSHASAASLEAFSITSGLTDAEARILSAMVDGQSPETCAQLLGLSIHTVRKHIQIIMDKTGCRRQVDLVRMAAGVH